MSWVLWCLAVMGALGAIFGVSLAVVSRFFRVTVDPRIEQLADALPGINCGACGCAGCEGYAEAVSKGAAPNLCIPGGHDTALKVAHIMGMTLEDERLPARAVVHCQGGTDRCAERYVYDGIADCTAANLLQHGPKKCDYGCLGYGNCARACPFGAITMDETRIPRVDWSRCTGCGTCVRTCPRGLIETLPVSIGHYIACSSQNRGKAVKKACTVGCIACWVCVKSAPEGHVEKQGNLPRLTYPDDADYAAAMEKCPMNCFVQVAYDCAAG